MAMASRDVGPSEVSGDLPRNGGFLRHVEDPHGHEEAKVTLQALKHGMR